MVQASLYTAPPATAFPGTSGSALLEVLFHTQALILLLLSRYIVASLVSVPAPQVDAFLGARGGGSPVFHVSRGAGGGVHRKRLCCLSISCRICEIGFRVFSADPSFSLRMLQLLRWADIIIPVNSMLFPQIALTGGVRTGVSQLCFWLVPSLLHLL